MITLQLVPGRYTQTAHGYIRHDDLIGSSEGTVITTVQLNSSLSDEQAEGAETGRGTGVKPVPSERSAGRKMSGWSYCLMRPRLNDYVLSMPRGAQIMYPKDIAQVLQLGDIRSGMRVLESGGGSGALGINLLEAVGPQGQVTTVEVREDFSQIYRGNVQIFYGFLPHWWKLMVGDFDSTCSQLEDHYFDRIVLDMLDPWNRLDQAGRVLAPGGILTAYVTTATQMSRMAEKLRESGHWTEPEIHETLERNWKADGLAVRPQHQMIGHTGFIIVSRAMADGYPALYKREKASKDTHTDIDSRRDLQTLQLRDMSDRKIRKVLRDLREQADNVTAFADKSVREQEDKSDRSDQQTDGVE